MPELFVIWAHLDFRTLVFPKQLTSFLLSRCQSKAFYLFWIISLKIIDFIPCGGILMDQKFENVLLFWTCLDIQTHSFSLLYLLRFSINEAIDHFFYLFLNVINIVLYIGIGMLIVHKLQKCY